MKKNLYFILLIMSSLLAACKKEPKEEVVGYRFTYENTLTNAFGGITEILYLINENDEIFKEKEIGKNDKVVEITAEKEEGNRIGYFRNSYSSADTRGFECNIIHNVPNGSNWNFISSHEFYEGIRSEITIENLPNFDSLNLLSANYNFTIPKPVYDEDKKELKFSGVIPFLDFSYICIREHKDSSFYYSLVNRKNLPFDSTYYISLDFKKMKKAKVVDLQIPKDIELYKIVAEVDNGLFNLYIRNFRDINAQNSIIAPDEKIKDYYVKCKNETNQGSTIFHDKMNDLSNIALPEIPEIKKITLTNGDILFKFVGTTKPLLVKHNFIKKRNGFVVHFYETMPFKDDLSLNRGFPKLPQKALNKFKELSELQNNEHSLNLFNFKDKNITYNTYLERYNNYKVYVKRFNTWVYDVGLSVSSYND